ncbi:MAG: WxcM-like domain-containing protein [Cytophagia bacterium]|nr:WxcM-like domain-containing protein [Cytophagia bacterium]
MSNKAQPYLFDVKKIGEPSIGYISIAESDHLPFSIKRVYWTYYTPDEVIRGNHAHKNLQQILVAVTGKITVDTVLLNGEKQTFELTKPNRCLYLPSMCWRTLKFSHNAVLMCLASEVFSESDYIRDFDAFIKSNIDGR